jgi:hypothetical protein
MLRRLAFVLVLLASGCGGSTPTAPAAPPPPTYPTMTGGWGGTVASAWTTFLPNGGSAPGGGTCSETWLIGSQSGGSFSGTYQGSGTGCADAGTMSGTVSTGGVVAFTFQSTMPSAIVCTRTSGDGVYNGVVSAGGALTAQRSESIHCTFFQEIFDRNVTATFSMNRR